MPSPRFRALSSPAKLTALTALVALIALGTAGCITTPGHNTDRGTGRDGTSTSQAGPDAGQSSSAGSRADNANNGNNPGNGTAGGADPPSPAASQQLRDRLTRQGRASDGNSVDGNPRDARLADAARSVLATLPVRPKTEWDGPFDRIGSFGEGWTDPDGNGCDARNDALHSAMDNVRVNRDRCRVESGELADPYSGQRVTFRKGPDTSDRVQIDHVVALYNAWRTGAQDLSARERIALSNDPLNLQPTLDWVNDAKASSDASQWLPPNEAYRCTYVERQIAVKSKYHLWVTEGEHRAMLDVLATCG